MALMVSKSSWLSIAPLLQFEGTVFWDTPYFPDILPQDNDIFVTVDSNYVGRLDLLAFDAYGDVDLWWVIALANGLELLPTDMVIGKKLRIPSKNYVDSIIAQGVLVR
jgi:hypothetical protein